jgi:hypothetical protein
VNEYGNEEDGLEIEDGRDDKIPEGLQSAVAAELRDAIDYIDEEVSPDRAKATSPSAPKKMAAAITSRQTFATLFSQSCPP